LKLETSIPTSFTERGIEVPRTWHLGNDIVDLADRRHAGKAGDPRFLQRIFTPGEQETIQASSDPDRTLWILWAGKEAAFKTISKSLGTPPTFNHRLFRVTIFGLPESITEPDAPPSREEGGVSADRYVGEVSHEEVLLPLRIELTGTSLHALSWCSDPSGVAPRYSWGFSETTDVEEDWREVWRPRFSAAEWGCISHRASALVRLEAKRALASSLGALEEELEIVCGSGMPGRRIPRVLSKQKELKVDLTLSHHGRLLAWAFVLE
jgi:hypothetical protein